MKERKIRECKICGKDFELIHGNEKYCSQRCAREALKKQKHDWYVENRLLRNDKEMKKELDQAYEKSPDELAAELREKYHKRINKQMLERKEYERKIRNLAYTDGEVAFGDFSNYEE